LHTPRDVFQFIQRKKITGCFLATRFTQVQIYANGVKLRIDLRCNPQLRRHN